MKRNPNSKKNLDGTKASNMTPNSAALIALIVAIVVFLALYYWANLTGMGALAIAAIVGMILQGLLLGTVFADLRGLAPAQIVERMGGVGFYALMALVYVLIILVLLVIYAVRDRRLLVVA